MRKMKKSALLAVLSGAMLFGWGGCLPGNFFGTGLRLFGTGVAFGAGQQVAAVPGGLLTDLINGFITPTP
jgi:hypothetical protein